MFAKLPAIFPSVQVILNCICKLRARQGSSPVRSLCKSSGNDQKVLSSSIKLAAAWVEFVLVNHFV
uniref:Uncharacterized protein n=1 Tax=Rhizophora mucronata TaxID=61149 RepID=A0A2P2JAS3_RHIMU